jgi:hypothetical protein
MLGRLPPARTRFDVLCRAFFAQFFASESVTSEMQLHKAMVGPLAFLLAPALLMPIQMASTFELAAIRFPALLEPLTQLMATIFITYSIVAIGVIAAVMWDALGFERRDAMVLGPLPLPSSTVVAAKVAAMGLLLLIVAFSINSITGVSFSLVAGNHKGLSAVVRHFLAHMLATTTACVAVFCLLVTLRAFVGGIAGRNVAFASILRFLLFSALLCFIVFMPTALHIVPGGRRRPSTVYLQPIPAWSPTNWFLGLYEWVRGSPGVEWKTGARRAVAFAATMVATAVSMTIAGYRRQLQLALTPSADAAIRNAARLPRAIAFMLTIRSRLARALADFVLVTLARSGAHQSTIAINAAFGLTLAAAPLLRTSGDVTQIMRPRTAVLWIPLVLVYWIGVGLRAAFFMPSELPASWSFRLNAPNRTPAFWAGTRAAAVGFLVPLALVADALLAPLIGVGAAAWHAAVVIPVAVVVAETIALTVDFLPFTRPYEPGHAKLKTRWPLYLLALYVFAVWPARAALHRGGDHAGLLQLGGWILAAAACLEIAGRWRARRWTMDPAEEFVEESSITVLDIGLAVHQPSRM